MTKIFWFASYPKSGNTWVRILLANYLAPEGRKVDINSLGEQGLAGGFARAIFDVHCGVKSSSMRMNMVERLRPDVYRAMAREVSEPLMLKIHDVWRRADNGEPVFPADVTASVVYILRNVLDVAPSTAHHWGLSLEEAVEHLCDENFTLAVSTNKLFPSLPQPLGSWSKHIRSWADEAGLPVEVIRYEDLKSDTVNTLGRITRHLNLGRDGTRLARAVAQSQFNILREQERAAGFREHSPYARGRFFRRGEVGAWKDEVPPHLVRKLIAAHGDMMHRFGYIDGRGNPTG